MPALRKRQLEASRQRRAARHPVLGYRWRHPERIILKVDGQCIYDNDRLYAHTREARKHNLPELRVAQWPPFASPILIVGSGLSVEAGLDEIKAAQAEGVPVMAVKGAHDWLISHGITPNYAVAADPQPERAKVFQCLNEQTIYLCASQMHPDTWPHMAGRKVILWHSETDLQHRSLPEFQGAALVPGGSTTGLRAMVLAYLLGYRDLRLYGFDSCVRPDGAHKLDGVVRAEDQRVEVFVGEERFDSTLSLVSQVQCLMPTLQMMPGVQVKAHGQGYFQAVLNAGKAAGWPV